MCVYLIPHQAAEGTPALLGDPACDATGSDLAWLCDHHAAGGALLHVVIQNELGELGGLPTARCPPDYHHRVTLDQGD